jgi:hypothetical protein
VESGRGPRTSAFGRSKASDRFLTDSRSPRSQAVTHEARVKGLAKELGIDESFLNRLCKFTRGPVGRGGITHFHCS